MKQSIILWASAIVLTFLIGFIQNRTSSEYPISGTIGIEGQKVSYLFNTIHRNEDDYKILLRSEIEELDAIVKWKIVGKEANWHIDTMQYNNSNLSSVIPKQTPLTQIVYNIVLKKNNKEYTLPKNEVVNAKFLGPVPTSISIHYFLTLFLGLLLGIRTGLEFFNNKPRLRFFSIFTLISFFSCAMIFAPVKKAYEMGIIGKTIPPIGQIFEGWLIILVVLWITNLILISYTKSKRIWVMVSSALTVLIFLLQNFSI